MTKFRAIAPAVSAALMLSLALTGGCSNESEKAPPTASTAATKVEAGQGTRAKGEAIPAASARVGLDETVTPTLPAPAQEQAVGRSLRENAKPASSPKRMATAGAARRGGGQALGYSGLAADPLSGALSGGPGVRSRVVAPQPNTERYAHVGNNQFLRVTEQPLSTFSVDVDTASYSNARRFLANSELPPKDAIRVEEWVNYFSYDYRTPGDDRPFAVNAEVSSCPWNAAHKLVRVGLKARPIAEEKVPPRNLVFLIDVSGSMSSNDKLPLLKSGLAMLARQLRPEDTIAMVVYAGSSGMVLPPSAGAGNQRAALEALGRLEAGGSTNGGDGIRLAYSVAEQHFKQGGINRVILATDGDFNVGTTSEGELSRLIEDKRKTGVFLTVLGFGQGNLNDSTMEALADKGNGNYAYIDSLYEAKKVLVREAGATLVAVAKDVKLQVEWNPTRVASYRLVGYENRVLAAQDFNDDKKDAGEIGAGHSVTAIYEIVPPGAAKKGAPPVDPLKYQGNGTPSSAAASHELVTVKIRYKQPNGDTSTKFQEVVLDSDAPFERASVDHRFAVGVASAALVLRGAPDMGKASLTQARAIAANALGADLNGDRHEFIAMLDRATTLSARQ